MHKPGRCPEDAACVGFTWPSCLPSPRNGTAEPVAFRPQQRARRVSAAQRHARTEDEHLLCESSDTIIFRVPNRVVPTRPLPAVFITAPLSPPVSSPPFSAQGQVPSSRAFQERSSFAAERSAPARRTRVLVLLARVPLIPAEQPGRSPRSLSAARGAGGREDTELAPSRRAHNVR